MARLGTTFETQRASANRVASGRSRWASVQRSRRYEAAKRAFDVGVTLLLLPFAAPLLFLGSLAVLLTTGQAPFFLQTRAGRNGETFRMIKLRTMQAARQDPPASKTPDDPRVTTVGRVLRRTSLDELPQLINVLLGHMSLVGPRPALPVEVAEYPFSWRCALEAKPGLTGLWQVSGRSELTPRQRIALDRCYMRRRSLAFDALLLLRTIGATLSMRGAW